jgi:3-methyladenine DNA glycosylase Tag
MPSDALSAGADGRPRCFWAVASAGAAVPLIEEYGSLAAFFWRFRFVGPTTAYSLMQAAGIVNDHVDGCAVSAEVEREQRETASRFS